jgi:hypothetical protein
LFTFTTISLPKDNLSLNMLLTMAAAASLGMLQATSYHI